MKSYLLIALSFVLFVEVLSVDLDLKDKPKLMKCVSECRDRWGGSPQKFVACYKVCFMLVARLEKKLGRPKGPRSLSRSQELSTEEISEEERSAHAPGYPVESESVNGNSYSERDVAGQIREVYRRILVEQLQDKLAAQQSINDGGPQLNKKDLISGIPSEESVTSVSESSESTETEEESVSLESFERRNEEPNEFARELGSLQEYQKRRAYEEDSSELDDNELAEIKRRLDDILSLK